MDLVPIRQGRINQAAAARRFRQLFGNNPRDNRWYHAYANVTRPYRPYVHNFTSGKRMKYAARKRGVGRLGRVPTRGTNRIIARKRYRRRRRLRQGTRVRKQALGLFEGKRFLEANRSSGAVAGGTVTRVRLFDDLQGSNLVAGDSTLQDNLFAGREFFARGIKISMLVANNDTASPVDIRIICGWRKIPGFTASFETGTDPNDALVDPTAGALHIFRNTITGQRNLPLNEADHGINSMNQSFNSIRASIDKKTFHVEKDFTFRLGPNSSALEEVFGSNVKRFSFWWELNNKRYRVKSQTLSDAAQTSNLREARAFWYPVMIYYHCNPQSTNQAATTVTYQYGWQVYYKDPLG